MENFVQFLNRLGLARVAAMGVVAALMIAFFAFLVLRVSSPAMAPIYSGLSLDDSAAIVKQLQSMNVPFELRGDGESILVPRDQVTTVRMTLAGDGLPSKGQVGYEIFDQQNTLGATSFVQNINNVRALEGELARTITSLNRIKSARVHLVLPQKQLFSRDQANPSASIALAVRGDLSTGEIRAIQHLVAAAVEGLTPDRVAIVDDSGQLLASGGADNGSDLAAAEADDQQAALEQRLRTRLDDLLTNILGPGRARVQVSAELNRNRSTKTVESFDPNGQVTHSTQTKSVQNTQSGPAASGAVSVSTQLPGAAQNSSGSPTASNTQNSQTSEETTNYDNSKTTETSTTDIGGIKRLTVAVAVDGTYTDDGKGNLIYAARSQAQLDQIKVLVQSAVGYDQQRGDDVQVVNLPFAQRPAEPAAGTAGPGLFDFTRDDLMNGAQMLVTLLIALALVFFVMRPLLKRVLTPEVPLTLPPSAELLPPGAATPEVAGELVQHQAQPGAPDWVDSAKSMGEQQLQTLKTVGTLVEENPKQAALIVRDWLNSPA
ncbi:MAG TPA: flagellar basal-body MS-ring/collar protein FliF [Devosiaceae bacterium]|nr:flagellar basal-body MS-ring/collar protein FliF [Devosiaceae bacterium]